MTVYFRRLALLAVIVSVTTGCVSREEVYCHETSYAESMYLYLKNDTDYQKQIELMDTYFKEATASGKKVAPGAYAHYALLKSKIGREGEAQSYLEKEKTAFPDSGRYLNSSMSVIKNNNNQANTNTAASSASDPKKPVSSKAGKGK